MPKQEIVRLGAKYVPRMIACAAMRDKIGIYSRSQDKIRQSARLKRLPTAHRFIVELESCTFLLFDNQRGYLNQ